MSTTIRNGYRLAAGTNAFEFARRVRAIMDPLRVLADGALLARLATAQADRHWHDKEEVKSILAYSVFNSWEEKQRALSEDSQAKDPHQFEMCLGEDPETGRILVRPYTKLRTMADAFEAMPDVEPYSYWSNWDAPAGITEDEWEQRGLAWQRVLPDYAPPAERMLTFTLRTEANPGTLMLSAINGGETDPVLTQIPDRTSRALRVAIHSYVAFLVTEGGLGTEAAAGATKTAAQSGGLQPLADLIEPHLWDIDRDLLTLGSGDRPLASDELLDQLNELHVALNTARKQALQETSAN